MPQPEVRGRMVQIFAALVLPLMLFAVACSGHDGGDKTAASTESTAVAKAPQPNANPTPIVIATPDFGAAFIDSRGGANADAFLTGRSGLFIGLNPAMVPGLLFAADEPDGVHPELASALLASEDLPAGFSLAEESLFALPMAAGGKLPIRLRFFGMDVSGSERGDYGTAVVAGAIPLTPETEALLYGSISRFQEDIQLLLATSQEIDLTFRDLRFLDASGLGHSSVGLHLEFEYHWPEKMTGVTPTRGDYTAFDMYAFIENDQVLVTWVMWQADSTPAVNARDLAEIMSQRAAANHP